MSGLPKSSRGGRRGRDDDDERDGSARMENSEDALDFTLSDGVDVLPSFDAMGLKEDLLRGIYAYGERPFLSCFRNHVETLLLYLFYYNYNC